MLNEWSDRAQPRRPRRFIASGEFWLGAFSSLVMLGLGVGFAGWLLD